MTDPAIQVTNLSKRFRMARDRRSSLKERLVRGSAAPAEAFWAVRDVSFTVERGSFFGVIGHNGSGKSTTLKLLAGIYQPTSGAVTVHGRVSALLELGAGFHPELTGRENIELNGSLLGLRPAEIKRSMGDIIEFSGIGDFIDEPVKVYSSGMAVRLGFSIAVKMDPEVLIVDEVIAVGDEEFQRRCFDYLFDLRQRGSTIVLVTHSMTAVETMCDHAIRMDHGRLADQGTAAQIVRNYLSGVNRDEAARGGHTYRSELDAIRIGSGEVKVTDVEYLDADGHERLAVVVSGEPCRIRVHYTVHEALLGDIGLSIHHESGVHVASPNTRSDSTTEFVPGPAYADFRMDRLALQPGTYFVSTAVAEHGRFIDILDRPFSLKVRGQGNDDPGLVSLPGGWELPPHDD